MKKLLSISIILLLVSSVFAQTKMTVEQYVNTYKDLAISEMHRSRIPASITLAQGLLESGNGNSRLAKEANNHFGIKCKSNWTGKFVREDDDEKQECFRAYETANESYIDHSEFLMKQPRYAFLFDLDPNDYKGWAQGLKQAGYATNPNYPQILISLIERHNLNQYDNLKPREQEKKKIEEQKQDFNVKHTKFEWNGLPVVIAKKGDSYTKLAVNNDLMIWQIYKYNDLSKDATIREGDTLYLKPKRGKSQNEFHTVLPGESMQQISQRNGIKLKKLYKLNRLKNGQEVASGEVLNLRKKRKAAPNLKTTNQLVEERKTVIVASPPIPPSAPVITAPEKVEEKKSELKEEAKADTVLPKFEPVQSKKDLQPTKAEEYAKDAQELAKAPVSVPEDNTSKSYFFHTVQPKETMYSISKKYNLKVDELKSLNKLNSDTLKIGMKLIINQNQSEAKQEEKVAARYHYVAQGETMFSIAKKYLLTVDELKALNNKQDVNISPGEKLIVLSNVKTPQPELNKEQYHTVEKGETMYSISKRYNLSVDELQKMNKMENADLKTGQKVRVR